VFRCSENNVRKLKNRYKFTLFVEAKIRKSEVRKSMDRCILNNLNKVYASASAVAVVR
jgi:hypothetical protein